MTDAPPIEQPVGDRKNNRQVRPAHVSRTKVSRLKGTLCWGWVWVLMDHDEFNLPESIPSHWDWIERKAKCRAVGTEYSKIHFILQAVVPQSPSAALWMYLHTMRVCGVDHSLGDTFARRALFTGLIMLSPIRSLSNSGLPVPHTLPRSRIRLLLRILRSNQLAALMAHAAIRGRIRGVIDHVLLMHKQIVKHLRRHIS